MKRITFLMIAIAALTGILGFTRTPSHSAAQEGASVFVTEIPSGYRDWKLVSVAHEEGQRCSRD